MNEGDILFVSYESCCQPLIVVSYWETCFNGLKYQVYLLTGDHYLYVRDGVQISSPVELKGHLIHNEKEEIERDDYYLKANQKHVLPVSY